MAWRDGDSIQSVIVTLENFSALCAHPAMRIGWDTYTSIANRTASIVDVTEPALSGLYLNRP